MEGPSIGDPKVYDQLWLWKWAFLSIGAPLWGNMKGSSCSGLLQKEWMQQRVIDR